MTQRTRPQRDLLTRAAAADTGYVEASEADRTAAPALIKRGLIISIPQKNGPSRLLITDGGRAAIGEPAPSVAAPPPRRRASKPQPSPTAPPTPKCKIPTLVELLKQPGGATIAVMMQATGWQAHSVRGAISGAIKKNLGLEVSSEKTDAGRIYHIAAEAQA